jgi:phosphorylcholine metabolism protein LicD
LKTLGVALIVKNEEKIIERALSSCKGIVDKIIICDTGSTDSTVDIIKNFAESNKILCEIYHVPWKNFGWNRTELLKLAKDKADYLLLLDADMTPIISKDFNKEKLIADAYYLHYLGNLDYAQVLLINNRLNWKYVGVTHEYIHSNEAKTYETLEEIKMQHLFDGTNRIDKFKRDKELLLQGILDEPNNTRYHFYLGQSYKDLGDYEKAIEYYLKAIKLNSWAEQEFYCKYQIGNCYEKLGKLNEAKTSYLTAWEFRPTRAEPLYRLALLCRCREEYQQGYLFAKKGLEIPYPKDLLFIEKSIYTWSLLFEKSICSYHLGKYREAYDECKKLMKIPEASESTKIANRRNIQFSEQKLFGKIITSTFNKEDAFENLKDIYNVCDKLSISVFPFAGTLLGIIREGDFIPHDLDMDFAIKLENYSPKLIEQLITNGFKFELSLGKLEKGYELRFRKRNIQVDFFLFYDKTNYICTYCYDNKGSIYEVKYHNFELIDYDFKGITIKIPNNTEEFLRQQYGDDWKIPKKNWNYLTDPKNIIKEG